MGEIYFNQISQDAEVIPTAIAYQDFGDDYSMRNYTMKWFDINNDGEITLDEYKKTEGQKQKWALEYTELRSYKAEVTNY